MNRDQARHAGAFLEHFADAMARRLRRDHRHVDALGRRDPAEADREAVREHQHLAGREVRRDLLLEQIRLHQIGHEDHDHVGPLRGGRRLERREAVLFRRLPAAAARPHADADVGAAVLQVQRVRVALRAVADHGDAPRQDRVQVNV